MSSVWLVLHVDSWTSHGDELRVVGVERSQDDAEALARHDARERRHGPVERFTYELQEWVPGEQSYRQNVDLALDLQKRGG